MRRYSIYLAIFDILSCFKYIVDGVISQAI